MKEMGAFCISYSILMNRGVRQHMGVELVAIIVSIMETLAPSPELRQVWQTINS